MKNNIMLDVDHPNKRRMEYFLNSVDEALHRVSFDPRDWKEAQSIVAGYKFKNSDQSLSITIIFATSYHDANEIAKANSLPALPHAKWSLNGNLLYLIESNDEHKVMKILSFFAGEE